ncbi:hypothetical protein [Rickettsia massiliae]|uniref:hypothetical protein n=1 Tax=Rickettsia massiliae TaxID=35791 RepID=UPI0003190E9D|nr:hypothetical protein [Rickettsia massiliae]
MQRFYVGNNNHNRHCERLKGAWQSSKNNKKTLKVSIFHWIPWLRPRDDGGEIDPRNKAFLLLARNDILEKTYNKLDKKYFG